MYVVAFGRPKMAYPDVENNNNNKSSRRIDSFLCLAANTYGYICLAGSRKFIRSVIIWVQDSALN